MRSSDAQRAKMDKLITSERIYKTRALHPERKTQMNAETDRQGTATKVFYAALAPEQQKVFEAEQQKRRAHGEQRDYSNPEQT